MSKMNKQQLEHLNRRLSSKLDASKTNHPLSLKLKSLELSRMRRLESSSLRIIQTMTKDELKQVALDQLEHGHRYGKTFEASLEQSRTGALERKSRNVANETVKQLEKRLTEALAPQKIEKQKVYDIAVFADSSAEVLEAINAFMDE